MTHGPHPDDEADLGPEAQPVLRAAMGDLCWLLSRDYAEGAATTLVGDRYQLSARQRTAIVRSSCSDRSAAHRASTQVVDLAGHDLHIDAFNVVIPLERALAGGPLLRGREGAWRDLGSVHNHENRDETCRAVGLLQDRLQACRSVTWWLDRPVSNSGRLAGLIREVDPTWTVELVASVDPVIVLQDGVIGSSDGWILEQGVAWVDLIGPAVTRVSEAWLVEMWDV